MLEPKAFIVDCDNVLLNWIDHFLVWAKKVRPNDLKRTDVAYLANSIPREIIMEFNESPEFGRLVEIPGSVSGMKRLKKLLPVHVLTCCGKSPVTRNNREVNLRRFFEDSIDKYIIQSLGAPKAPVISRYHVDSIVIDDDVSYCISSKRSGYTTIMLTTPYNAFYDCSILGIIRCSNWQEVGDICESMLS